VFPASSKMKRRVSSPQDVGDVVERTARNLSKINSA
jgi:hypothetical protein